MLWAHTNLCKYCVNSSYQTCSGRSPESSRTVPPPKRPHTDSVCPLWLWCAWIHQQPRFCEETSGSRQTLFQAAGFPSWHVWFLYEGVCFPGWGNLEFIEKLLVLQFAMENIENFHKPIILQYIYNFQKKLMGKYLLISLKFNFSKRNQLYLYQFVFSWTLQLHIWLFIHQYH